MKVLELKDVSKTFFTKTKEINVLKNINITVEEGEIIAIVGPSGAGKSTILNLISGLIRPSSGEVNIYGDIGYMFQKDQLLSWRTIWKNVIFGLEVKKIKDQKYYDEVEKLLKEYGLDEFKNNFPKELSGGMRQRIALIRTLATKPNVLLLDEPFSALDFQTRMKVSDDVYDMIRKEHLSAILVTHDLSEAIALADKVIVLSPRPARIKNIHQISFDESVQSPLQRRTHKSFQKYFEVIWSELCES